MLAVLIVVALLVGVYALGWSDGRLEEQSRDIDRRWARICDKLGEMMRKQS